MKISQKPITSFSGEFRFLSNFYPSRIEMDGEFYPTVEHAYQAAKTLDLEERKKIRLTRTAGNAKRIGRAVTLRRTWEEIKIPTMFNLVLYKFTGPGSIYRRDQLKSTYPRVLIEGNTWGDSFWGVYNGRGHNHLGLILMDVRLIVIEKKPWPYPASSVSD